VTYRFAEEAACRVAIIAAADIDEIEPALDARDLAGRLLHQNRAVDRDRDGRKAEESSIHFSPRCFSGSLSPRPHLAMRDASQKACRTGSPQNKAG
jgi:hypothetical protein